MASANPPPSLLFFDPPLLVEGPAEAAAAAAAAAKKAAGKGAASQLEDIINSVLPPRMWQQEDADPRSGAPVITTWMQCTSKTPASRADVLAVERALDQRLEQRQARLTGICAVREELYRQSFDELLRQVTLDLPERGLLLLRVRDEIRMTIDAYKTLYESSITFGVRKQLQAEAGIPQLEAALTELQERKKELEASAAAVRAKIDVVERRQAEKKALDEKRRSEELAYLKHQGKHLEAFLKTMPKA